MITPSRNRTAFHEAGHAIVAYALGRTAEYVEIDPNSLSGRCQMKELPANPNVPIVPPPNILAERLAFLLSGDRAEYKEFGDYDETLETATALRFACGNPNVGPAQAQQFIATLGNRIDKIICSNETLWRSLAARLLSEDRIDGPDLNAMLSTVVKGSVYP